MTEDQQEMDMKSVQQRVQLSSTKRIGIQDDLKKNHQRFSKRIDDTRTVVWNSDNRLQSNSSKKKTHKSDNVPKVLKESEEDGYSQNSGNEIADNVQQLTSQHKTLTNFRFSPLDRSQGSLARKGNHKSWVKSPVYTKEAYLQANCQFVVQQEGNYALHAIDPDVIVEWKLVEQVCISSHDFVTCPICLEAPIAGKITKCGHVYCWSCILHYLSLSEKAWRKCPICYDAIVAEDLKSVVTSYSHAFSKGEKITMKLMKRKKGSMFSWPISYHSDSQESFVEWTGDTSSSNSKLQISSPENVLSKIIECERIALEKQLQDARSELSGEDCFIEMAIQKLKEKEIEQLRRIQLNKKVLVVKHQEPPKANGEPLLSDGSAMRAIENKMVCVSVDEPAFSDDETDNVELEDADEKEAAVETGNLQPTIKMPWPARCSSQSDGPEAVAKEAASATGINSDFYYFYQAEDGQNIYIHPINVRCLVREYGCLQACPQTISAQIINNETITMTKGLRSRYRYLSHLPVSCGFLLCELMLKPPIVSRETLLDFSEEFHMRKLQRQKKKREERKLERKIESRRTTDMFGREIVIPAKEVPLNLESLDEFPSQSGNEYPEMSVSTELAVSPNSWGTSSFATALQNKSKAPAAMPWPARCRADSNFNGTRDASCLDDDYAAVPSFAASFSDALSASMASATSKKDGWSDQQPKSNKKKQKGKKLLFSTGGFVKYS